MSELAKTHMLFPKPLLRKIDRAVGVGHRSRFVIEAAAEKLARLGFLAALKSSSGAWSSKRHPDLRSQEGVNRFLKKVRRRSSKRFDRALRG